MSLILRVVDLQRMLQFYVDALDWTVERRQVGIGLVQLRAGSARIDLGLVDSKLEIPAMRRPASKGETSITSVCASNPSSARREVAVLMAEWSRLVFAQERPVPIRLPTFKMAVTCDRTAMTLNRSHRLSHWRALSISARKPLRSQMAQLQQARARGRLISRFCGFSRSTPSALRARPR